MFLEQQTKLSGRSQNRDRSRRETLLQGHSATASPAAGRRNTSGRKDAFSLEHPVPLKRVSVARPIQQGRKSDHQISSTSVRSEASTCLLMVHLQGCSRSGCKPVWAKCLLLAHAQQLPVATSARLSRNCGPLSLPPTRPLHPLRMEFCSDVGLSGALSTLMPAGTRESQGPQSVPSI